MSGFAFGYRLNGQPPTIERFPFKSTQTISRGDMLSIDGGAVEPARAGASGLVGAALETLDGEARTTAIRAIVDADAVYAVRDPRIRLKGAVLDLTGDGVAQAVGAGPKGNFVVDVDSRADEVTYVFINGASHYAPGRPVASGERPVGGALNAAIARTVVRYYAEQLGRGPTRARAFFRDNIVVIVLEDTMTQAERSLLTAGQDDAVLNTKSAVQHALAPYLKSAIERLTGCKVRAFMSANHLEPDLAAELFVLDRPVPGQPAEELADAPEP